MAYEDRIMRMADSVPQRTVQPSSAFGRERGWQRAGPATGPYDAGPTPNGRGRGWQRAGPATGLVDYEDYIKRTQGGMDSGQFLTSRFSGGLGDQFAMNDGARGMLEDAGVEYAQYTDPATKMKGPLWIQANRNVNPEGITPQPLIVKEWERLKEEYWKGKARVGYTPGE